ncbi:hypothetical protein Ahia01_000718600 [Argonauta hians]
MRPTLWVISIIRHVIATLKCVDDDDDDEYETKALYALNIFCSNVCRSIISKTTVMMWLNVWKTLLRYMITMIDTNKMLFKISLIIYIIQCCVCEDIVYTIEENKAQGTYVGDVAVDSRILETIPVSEKAQLQFRFDILKEDLNGNSTLFTVAEFTGKLYTANILDSEKLCKPGIECYILLNIAVKHDQLLMDILKVKIILLDVNDNRPEFTNREVQVHFSEGDSKGTRKAIPYAIDKDIGELNSMIHYYIHNNSNIPFSLLTFNNYDVPKLYIVIAAKLDREITDYYQLKVVAKDGGKPPRYSYLLVRVTVTDINDNAPMFLPDTYDVSIDRKLFTGECVIKLNATDADIGKNGQISYYFTSQTSIKTRNYFNINQTTGVIYLRKRLIQSNIVNFKLFVKAVDDGKPSLSGLADVFVKIINVDNHAPKIIIKLDSTSAASNTAEIPEDIRVGSFIGYIEVIDNDRGWDRKVACSLRDNTFQLYNLGPKKFRIVIKSPIDREKKDMYNLTMVCKDKGTPPLWSRENFYILIKDVNDVPPRFSKTHFKFWVYENQESNFPVGFVNASDPDLGDGGKLSYTLLNVNGTYPDFHITDYGYISTRVTLDREKQEIYLLRVFVKDRGIISLNNTALVTIEVMDVNDNAPDLIFPNVNPFFIHVFNPSKGSRNITVIKATDKDIGKNADLKYTIATGNEKGIFTLDIYDGKLSFSRDPLLEDAGIYNLEIRVEDNGTPVLHSTTNISLTLSIRNTASKTLTSIQLGPNVRIHKNLFIVIVSVVVIASVCIVVLITMGLLCNNNRNRRRRRTRGDKVNTENRQLTEKDFQHLPMTSATSQIEITVSEISRGGNTSNLQIDETRVHLNKTNEADDNIIRETSLHIPASAGQNVQSTLNTDFIEKPKPTPRSRKVDIKLPEKDFTGQTTEPCQI